MSLTVLFDLDDTLLNNPLDIFMRDYIGLLSIFLSPFTPPEKMVPQLLQSTDLMIAKDTPCKTLEMTFDEDFYPKLGLNKTQLKELISAFYENEFGTLKNITAQIPEAIQAVEFAFRTGCQVIIATNPLFPLRANLHRLDWAGLSNQVYPYSLITSYETMHFAKPNPAYYAEILGKLGWMDQPVCVIGNSLTDDILPAKKLGIPSYFLQSSSRLQGESYDQLIETGTHAGIIPWLKQQMQEEHAPVIDGREGITAVLKSTPAVLSFLTDNLTESQWLQKPKINEWSIQEVICHLRDVENEVNIPRLMKFLGEDNPFISGVDSDPWVNERAYNNAYTPDALIHYCSARASLLKILDRLSEDDWEKYGQHSIFGPTTLREILGFISVHDRDHANQIKKNLNQIQ